MIKRMLIIGVWFPATLSTLLACLVLLLQLSQIRQMESFSKNALHEHYLDNSYQMYAALPAVLGSFSSSLEEGDARPEIVKRFLEKYDSPLLPYAEYIVLLSDEYNLDFRLIVAIAQCESNVCKKIPEESFNCWGFENGATKFRSWEHALLRVAQTLKDGYIDQGLITPEQIMPKYAPPSVAKGGPWAKCVSHFLQEME